MGKELLLLGIGAAAVAAYVLSTSSPVSALAASTGNNTDAAGSFSPFPQVGGSQFGGVSSPTNPNTPAVAVGAGGTVTNPTSAGQNTPAAVPAVSTTGTSTSYVPDYRSYLGDKYFLGWVAGSSQGGTRLNQEREALVGSRSVLGKIIARELSGGNRIQQDFKETRGGIKLDDLFNEAKNIALATQGKGDTSLLDPEWMGANLSVDSVQKALYESLRSLGVR